MGVSMKAKYLVGLLLAGCAGSGSYDVTSGGRIHNLHQELTIVDPSVGSSGVSGQAVVSIGSVYLESQVAPVTVAGTGMQASDISVNAANTYVSYSSFDTGGTVVKAGAVEHLKPYICDNPLTLLRTEYCMTSAKILSLPAADIFAAESDGTNLFAVGSTLDETDAPNFGRIYKIGLDTNKSPVAVSSQASLPSYAGTDVAVLGSQVLVTSGTSPDTTRMGGLSVLNKADFTPVAFQQLYDARGIGYYGSTPSRVFVTRGKFDSGNLGALVEYNADGSGSPVRTIASGGNTIAESKSSVQVGNTLLLASLGDQGFKVLCKATGAVLHSQPAVTVSGIPSTRTVTNSVVAIPGFIFAANGEGGVYVYQFQKSSILNSNYCQGVAVTLVGRLTLGASTSYINSELSANSIHYVPVYNLLNVLTAKLLVVASGNKGTSLINVSGLTLSLGLDVDDF